LWSGRTVVVGVCGGIACYKVATVVSRLAQAGASVRVVMTEAATRFVGPLTFQSLSGHPVVTSIWHSSDHHDSQHVGVARSADLMIIAPATADMLAKLSAGICDDPVSLVASALPRRCPVLLAPAMNEQMWENPITQRNVRTLAELAGYRTVGPEAGWQACRTAGAGRMSEPEAIMAAAAKLLGAPATPGRPA
jgi:phosphopantothenoylcysteine decarboxylase/phosphopantothenate--cysteine ligase